MWFLEFLIIRMGVEFHGSVLSTNLDDQFGFRYLYFIFRIFWSMCVVFFGVDKEPWLCFDFS